MNVFTMQDLVCWFIASISPWIATESDFTFLFSSYLRFSSPHPPFSSLLNVKMNKTKLSSQLCFFSVTVRSEFGIIMITKYC